MVSEAASALQSLIARLEAPAPAAARQPVADARPAAAGAGGATAAPASAAAPRVAVPDDAVAFDPLARRGTYLNVVV